LYNTFYTALLTYNVIPGEDILKKTVSLRIPGKPKPYIMAHRGNRVVCPENTLAAFRRAITDGADILETDLHLSADEVFVCIHDSTVDRTTNGSGAVAEMTLAALKQLNASCGREKYTQERIPTLAEVAALLPEDIALALELKTDRFLEPEVCRRLAEELGAAGVRDRTVVLSFSTGRLKAFRQAAPDIPIGFITLDKKWPLKDFDLLGPAWNLLLKNPLYVMIAHLRGQLVAPLDPDSTSRYNWYHWLKADAVLADDPAAASAVLRRKSR